MSIQQNVAQQNDTTLSEIRRAVAAAQALPWLSELLQTQGLRADGLLARLSTLPDQGGDWCSGTWLSHDEQFWDFAVLLKRDSAVIVEIEHFDNVTQSISGSPHTPGTGKSFGYLAKHLLHEMNQR